MSVYRVVTSFLKTIAADREVPPSSKTTAAALDRLYASRTDPWGVTLSPFAHQRYLALVNEVGRLSPCVSILDVGCGEGTLTRYVAGFASMTIGIDVSEVAIGRARQAVPRATFECVRLEDYQPPRPFSIVLAIEVLYYVPSVPEALQRLLSLGDDVIVSYTSRERDRIEPHLASCGDGGTRRFYPFYESAKFGFTVAHLTASPDSAFRCHASNAGAGTTLVPDSAYA